MFRPRYQQDYWYIDFDEQGAWLVKTRCNSNEWIDQYNFSIGNCYADAVEAEGDVYRIETFVKGE